jgi:tetratricopeptide (TPR) repeat protein
MKTAVFPVPGVRRLALLLIACCACVSSSGSAKSDAEAQIKKLTEQYRKTGMPEPAIEMMIQMERERLFPEERAAAEKRRAIEGRQRARANLDEDGEETDSADRDATTETSEAPAQPVLRPIGPLNSRAIQTMPPPFASEADVLRHLKALATQCEAALDSDRGAVAAPYLGRGRQTGYAGIGFWLNHELDVGIYLMLKACIAQPDDLVLLNNFAACLSMSGVPEKAVPLLDYLNRKIPGRPTVLNNLGQAWLGLGEIAKATASLEQAVALDGHHPEARRSLAAIANHAGDPAKAGAHLEQALGGGFDVATYNQWRDFAPGRDVAPLLRANYSRHYREVAITKRWQMPDMPADVVTAQASEATIAQFFANLDATISDIRQKSSGMQAAVFQKQAAQFQQMGQQVAQMQSLDDVKAYQARFGGLFHPLKAKAQIMLNALRSGDFATSYEQRIARAENARSEALAAFAATLRPQYGEITAFRQQINSMEGGEGDEEVIIEKLEQKICALRAQIQQAEISGHARINLSHVREVEMIANQRLQEAAFWTALYDLPNDTAPGQYGLYEQYLSELRHLKNLYPLPAPLRVICGGGSDPHRAGSVTGKIQLWEDSHCPINIDINIAGAHGRMNCREMNLGLKIEGVAVNWDRQLDPVTWEVVGHSISVAGGVREFEGKLTDNLTGKVSVDAKVTIKLDAELMPTDLIVKTEAGAELSGPGGGKTGADLGSAEISVQGGFRGDGPVPELVGALFR